MLDASYSEENDGKSFFFCLGQIEKSAKLESNQESRTLKYPRNCFHALFHNEYLYFYTIERNASPAWCHLWKETRLMLVCTWVCSNISSDKRKHNEEEQEKKDQR